MVQDSLSSLTLIWYVVGGSLWYSCHGIADVCECLPAFMPQIGILEVVAELCGCGSDRSVIHGSPLVDLCKDVAMKNMFVLYQVGGKDLLDGIFAKLLDYESWKVPFFFGQIWFTHGILGQRFMPCNFMIWGWRASFFSPSPRHMLFSCWNWLGEHRKKWSIPTNEPWTQLGVAGWAWCVTTFSKYESRPNYQNVLVGITMRTMIFLIYHTSPKGPAAHFPIVHRLDGYCLIDFHIMCTATGVFSEKFTCWITKLEGKTSYTITFFSAYGVERVKFSTEEM